jgi:hypothetical protein
MLYCLLHHTSHEGTLWHNIRLHGTRQTTTTMTTNDDDKNKKKQSTHNTTINLDLCPML